jgi:predicted dehydrogenase
MEKPPGLTARETRSIIAAAENAGVATRVAFNRRYMPIVARLMEMATADGAPPLEHIELDFHRVGRKDADFSTTAIHAVDLARFIARSDYASAKLSYQSGPGLDNVFLDCVFVSGGTARITLCPDAGLAMERVTAVARGVTFLVSLPGQDAGDARESLAQYRSDHDGRTGAPYPADDGSASKRNGFFDENAGFFDELQAGRRPSGGVEDALQSVEITECMRKKRPLYPAGHPARHPAAESP